ncbi:MAG: GDSL-type esterase/lipase family protein [Planctomyces sp.]|jgi:lysophospholipase L1-like esterase
MRPVTFFCTVLLALFGVGNPAVVVAQDPAQAQWFSIAAAEGKSVAWSRWAVDGSGSVPQAATLSIASDSRCSLYVNGQRLLKYDVFPAADGQVTARMFDVQPLLRPGRNMVAVEVQGEASAATFGVQLKVVRGGQATVAGGQWKQAPAPPPVGWEQTDFNDRDWKELKALPQLPPLAAAVRIPEKAESPAFKRTARRSLPLEFQDGDHVVLVGATFVERAQLSEHLESVLAGTLGNRRVTFRNLGWSADTVFAESRGIFDAPAVGYMRMVEHIRAEEPAAAILCYGQNEALMAGMSPEQFSRQFGQFIDELQASGIPCLVVSPHELFPAKPPVPSPARFNSRIRLFAEAAGSVAQSRQLPFVDLFSDFTSSMQSVHSLLHPDSEGLNGLTDNGMHLSEQGYACAALVIRQRLLGIPANPAVLKIDVPSATVQGQGLEIADVSFSDDRGQVTLKVKPETLSPLPITAQISAAGSAKPATAVLFADSGYSALRQLILKKNELYFHRWRPQNVTYLFGFRKHEQGNNAADIARFDPFIREVEQQIHVAQQPQWTTVTISLSAAAPK